MKAHVIGIAGIGLFFAFTSAIALAQGAAEPAPNTLGTLPSGSAPSALGPAPNALGSGAPAFGPALPLPEPFTPESVAPARPFGNIDISRAGTTTAQVRTWAQGRTPMERNELSGRCQVISDPANSSRYPSNAQEFCRTYSAMQVITPPALKY
jgi:hypothetical protein